MAGTNTERARSRSPLSPHSHPPPPAAPSSGSGTGLRRAATSIEDANQFRHRASPRVGMADSPTSVRRRSSTFSDLSFTEARRNLQSSTDDLLLPKAEPAQTRNHHGSHWDSTPLAFALLPALGGMVFQNGSSVITDIMLLGLAAIFLNWSVRLPWNWYHSAQSLRAKEERNIEHAIDEDSEDDSLMADSRTSLDDVPEDHETPAATKATSPTQTDSQKKALRELYFHEISALMACFIAPLLGAYLLHTIRNQLSRPSEGLVSNYNLTIFLLASELRPLGHLAKLIQARTLHLQRVVNHNPHTASGTSATSNRIRELLSRVEELESHSSPKSAVATTSDDAAASSKQAALVLAEVRRTLQPELDALNRAVRRYEKRAALQSMQTESRLRDLDSRLNDAISLAAAAAKNSQSHSLLRSLLDGATYAALLPIQAFSAMVKLPFKMVTAATGFGRKTLMRSGRGPAERDLGKKSNLRPNSGRFPQTQGRISAEKLSSSRLGKR